MGIIFFGIVVIGSVIYAANMQPMNNLKIGNIPLINILLLGFAILGLWFGGRVIFVSYITSLPQEQLTPEMVSAFEDLDNVNMEVAIAFLLLSIILSCISIAIVLSAKFRQWIANVVIRNDGIHRRYNPDSAIHTTAIVLAFLQILNVVGGFVLAGGIEGLADDIAANSSIDILLGGLLLNVLVALLGVGLFLRRDWAQTRQRLGLEAFTVRQLLIGAGVGFVGFWVVYGVALIWASLVTPEQLAAQSAASEQLFLAFSGSLFAGFVLAATAAIGEEILLRGALQPVFGIFWTSIFFASLHTQYFLTPALLMIFGLSIAFGWLRRRYNTTTAIVAHFVYNFIPFLLFYLASQIPTESMIP